MSYEYILCTKLRKFVYHQLKFSKCSHTAKISRTIQRFHISVQCWNLASWRHSSLMHIEPLASPTRSKLVERSRDREPHISHFPMHLVFLSTVILCGRSQSLDACMYQSRQKRLQKLIITSDTGL